MIVVVKRKKKFYPIRVSSVTCSDVGAWTPMGLACASVGEGSSDAEAIACDQLIFFESVRTGERSVSEIGCRM